MTESFSEILYSVTDRVATITLNRPERMNAWSAVMEAETRAAFALAVADDAVRAIVLTATGKGFCVGADVSAIAKRGAERQIYAGVTPPPGEALTCASLK
jgi:enoyl-CoA hydratase/carnithine racemase